MDAYNTLVLNPEWISEGIYQIINWVSNQGSFKLTFDNFKEVFDLNIERYPVKRHQFCLI